MVSEVDEGPLGACASARDATVKDSKRRRILIADDDHEIREMFKYVLSTELPNCGVDLASNGEQALKLFKKERHAVLLLDLHMPVMDGADAFMRMIEYCKSEDVAEPKAVFITAYDPPHTVREILHKNPAHCLMNKPIRNEDLVEVVRERLE